MRGATQLEVRPSRPVVATVRAGLQGAGAPGGSSWSSRVPRVLPGCGQAWCRLSPATGGSVSVRSRSMRAEQDFDLFVRLQDPDDPVTREFVVERFLPLARSVARTHASNADTFDDVFQVACFGL